MRKHFNIHIQGEIEDMAQIQITLGFSVAPAPPPPPPPLTATVNTITGLTVGIPVPDGTIAAHIDGGVGPYTIAADPQSQPLPPGLNLEANAQGDILLKGTPTQDGTFPGVVLDIADSQ